MATRITFEFEGEVQLDRTLQRFELAAADATPVWHQLGDRFAEASRQQFDTEGSYGSGGWDPLSPRYAAWKARRYPGKPIMRRSDDTYNSLTQRPFGIENITEHSAEFGTGLAYPPFHQRGEGNNPVRKVVDLPESERRIWAKALQSWLVTGRLGSF